MAKGAFTESAWKLGCEGGCEAVKIRTIAEAVGVSGALIYSYFEDKASLMDELRHFGASLLEDRLTAELAREAPDTLLRLTTCYVAYMREHAWLYSGESKHDAIGPTSRHARAFMDRAALLLGGSSTAALHLWLSLRGVVVVPFDAELLDQAFVDAHLELCVRGVQNVPTRHTDRSAQADGPHAARGSSLAS